MNLEKQRKLTELNEGRRNRMYKDSLGIETIGIGHNLRDVPLSDRAVDLIFEDDLNDVMAELDRNIPWWRGLDDVRQAVLVDLCFNMGWPRLAGFKNTLAAIKAGVYEAAASGMENSKWYTQVGRRGPRMVTMMRTGEWPKGI